jgi:hypothetical protein
VRVFEMEEDERPRRGAAAHDCKDQV